MRDWTDIQVEVTEHDWNTGKRGSYKDCPVALAIQRKLKPCYKAFVGKKNVDILGISAGYSPLPLMVQNAIHDFDASQEGKHTTYYLCFTLRVPTECVL